MTGEKDTKAELTERVVTADSERVIKFGDKDYTIYKMKWKVALPFYKKVRKLLAKVVPSVMGGGFEGLDWEEILSNTPLEILVELVNSSTDLTISLDPSVENEVEPTLELVLCLAGEAFKFNFIDSEGVQRFFGVIRSGINNDLESQISSLPSSKLKEHFVETDLQNKKGIV